MDWGTDLLEQLQGDLRSMDVVTLFTILMTVVTFVVYTFSISRLRENRRRRIRFEARTLEAANDTKPEKAALKRFSSALLHGLESGTLATIEDAQQVFEGAMGELGSGAYFALDLEYTLQRLLVDLLSDEHELVPETVAKDEAKRMALAAQVKLLICAMQAEAPFAGAPKLERGLLADALRFGESGDVRGLRERLGSLSSSISTRANDIESLQGSSRLSLWLAAFGAAATVLFGPVALFK